jgi:hypothetical protein
MTALRCPPLDARFAGKISATFADEVLERLDVIGAVAAGAPLPHGDVIRSRQELARLVAAWRRLLQEHQPDGHDRCTRCRTRGGLWRAGWPCRVWIAAHNRLITDPAARLR